MIRDELYSWLGHYSINTDRERILVNLSTDGGGIGDAISALPAFRHLRKLNPDKNIIFFTFPSYLCIFNRCRYIDQVMPLGYLKDITALKIRPTDHIINAECSFEEYHRDHVVKSNIRRICEIDSVPNDTRLDYEIEIYDHELPIIEQEQKKLLDAAGGKPLLAIAPAYTMFSRIWQTSYWESLVDMLKSDGYFVVSFGHTDDLYVHNVDLDIKGKHPIPLVPSILDIFEAIFLVNSGMAHIAGINQDVRIIYLCIGQFPTSALIPFRRGNMAHNMTVIDHNCPLKRQCFMNHVTERSINKQTQEFIDLWQKETRTYFPEEEQGMLTKYICWNYCDKEVDKFECSRMITPEMVYAAFKEG